MGGYASLAGYCCSGWACSRALLGLGRSGFCLSNGINSLWAAKCGCIGLGPGLGFSFEELYPGMQKGKAFLYPKFPNGSFLPIHGTVSVAGCVCSRAVHAVRQVGVQCFAMSRPTAVATDWTRVAPLFGVSRPLIPEAPHRFWYVQAN
jgi:hypothetical protein